MWRKLICRPLIFRPSLILFTASVAYSANATCLIAVQKLYEKDVKTRYREIVYSSPENRTGLIDALMRDGQFLKSEDHTRLFRRSQKTGASTEYILNQIEALFYDFLPWFLGETNTKFIQMLSKLHITACIGKNRDRPYTTNNSNIIYSSTTAGPGFYIKTRSDLLPLSQQIEKIRAKYAKKLHTLTPAEKNQLIYELGLYHHLFVRIHPFMKVNNSIVMSQINLILILSGVEPIWHNGLDLMALGVKDPDRYAASFREYVLTGSNALLSYINSLAESKEFRF